MIWRAFKFVFSAVLLLLAGLFATVYLSTSADPGMLGFASFLVFFAAALWIDYTNPSRTLGLAAIVFALGIGFLAVGVLDGTMPYLKECHGRGRLLCELQNLLYRIGGRPAAAVPWFVLAAAVLYGSYVAFKRARAA